MNDEWTIKTEGEALTFDDVLIVPQFSEVNSRKDVDLSTSLLGASYVLNLDVPIISANMASITESKMANEMYKAGGLGILHRFMTIEKNIEEYVKATNSGVSIGLGDKEKERFEALYDKGAKVFCVDVAHGAQMSVVEQVKWIKEKRFDILLIVGNFATRESIQSFEYHLGGKSDLYKVGIGSGSVCTTRLKTGVGYPQLLAIAECAEEYQVIADGGIRNPGDIAKALGAGAKAVMLGGMLAGTDETPESTISTLADTIRYKKYAGSASGSSSDEWKTAEGIETMVKVKGPLEGILKDIEGGLRSSLSYTGSRNLEEFRRNVEFVKISQNTLKENRAHINETL